MSRVQVLQLLERHGITYQETRHAAVFTMADYAGLNLLLPGSRCKNLLAKGRAGFPVVLLLMPAHVSVDLGALGRRLSVGRLSLCSPQEMWDLLGITPGALSPLALVKDCASKVRLLLDEELRKVQQFQFHPMENTSTVALEESAFRRYIDETRHAIEFLAFPRRSDMEFLQP